MNKIFFFLLLSVPTSIFSAAAGEAQEQLSAVFKLLKIDTSCTKQKKSTSAFVEHDSMCADSRDLFSQYMGIAPASPTSTVSSPASDRGGELDGYLASGNEK